MSEPLMPQADDSSATKTVTVTEPIASQAPPLKRSHVVAALAAGLCICFFLPWLRVLYYAKPSGFDIAREKSAYLFLLSIPILGVITCCVAAAGKNYKLIGQLAATAPFVIFVCGLFSDGMKIVQAMQAGAWISLFLGFALLIAARK